MRKGSFTPGWIKPGVSAAACAKKCARSSTKIRKASPCKSWPVGTGMKKSGCRVPQAGFSHYWPNRSSDGAEWSSEPGSTKIGRSCTATRKAWTDWLHSGAANTCKAGSGRHSGRQGHSCNRAAKYYSPGHPARLRDCTGSSGKNTAICSPWTSYATGYPARAYGKNTWRGSLQIYLRRAGSTGFISGINAPDGKSTVSLPAFHLLKKRPCILKNFTGTCTCADSSPIYICVHPAIGVRQNRANPGLILPWRIFGGSNV